MTDDAVPELDPTSLMGEPDEIDMWILVPDEDPGSDALMVVRVTGQPVIYSDWVH